MTDRDRTAEGVDHLGAVRRRRESLYEDLARLERALQAPLGDGVAWKAGTRAAGSMLADEVRAHVAETEGENGFLTTIREDAPRLDSAVTRLIDEHAEMVEMVDRFLAQLDQPDEGIGLADVRALGVSLLGMLVRHRQRGADLIYEAYQVDLGSGG